MPSKDNLLFREEVFGPVLAILCCNSVEEMVSVANETPFGLASVVLGKDLPQCRRVAELLEAGAVYINKH